MTKAAARCLLLLLAAAAFAAAAVPAPPAGDVILIGWDGARRARVMELLEQGRLPNLRALAAEGSLAETRVATGATETKPGWAEILTGRSAVKLKILSNEDYRPIPKGLTVFELLKARFGSGITTIFITGKQYNLGSRGPHAICVNAVRRDPVTGGQTNYQDKALFKGGTVDGKPPRWEKRAGEPYFNAVKAVDLRLENAGPAEKVGALAADAIEKHKDGPFFAFVHFQEPDEQGHVYGEASPEYSAALARADAQLGTIVAKLRALGLYSRTTVLVTADHGFDEGKNTHRNAPFMTLAVNAGRKLRPGDRKDITPTILQLYGFKPGDIRPPLDGRSLLTE
jgi:hypothetical protein